MWFKKKQVDPLKTIDDIYSQVEEKFNQRIGQLQKSEQSLRSELSELQKTHSELIGKLREQTDADILLLCKKIEKDILADKKVDQNQMIQLRNLQTQQSALAQQGNFGYAGGGLAGALGLHAF